MSTSVCIRVPDEVLHRIEVLAETLERPKSYIIRKAIEEYLDESAEYLIAMERLKDKDDEIISGKELRDKLAQ